MRLLTVLIVFAMLMLMTTLSLATTYRYLDSNGTTCYADGLENVPEQYRSHVVIVVSGKHATPIKKANEATPAAATSVAAEPEKSALKFRFNWLVLFCLMVSGFIVAHRIRQKGRIEQAFRIQLGSVVAVLLLFVPMNLDIVRSVTGSVKAKKQQIQTEMKEQAERDKKPLKTLSEKVDEMMQQVQK